MNISTVSDIEKHSAAHVLAMAVARVYPQVKIGVGPVTKTGFFYDFDIPGEVSKKNIQKIEDEVKKIIAEDQPFQQIIIPRAEAINMMLQRGQIYKSELINSIPDEEISFFKTGDEFIDLCRGPHVNSTRELGPIKLSIIEDVYWNNDPKRPKLKRISGILFKNEEEAINFEKVEQEKISRDFHKFAVEKGYGIHQNGVFQLSERGYRFVENLNNQILKKLELGSIRNYKSLDLSGDISNISQMIDKAVFVKEPSFKHFPINILSRFISKDLPLKDTKAIGETILIKRYTRQNDIISGVGIIEKFIKIFNESNIEFYGDLKYHNIEDQTYNQISMTMQRNLISHNKLQSDFKDYIEVDLKTNDELGREWIFAKMKFNWENLNKEIIFNGKKSPVAFIEFAIFPLNILAFYLENFRERFPSLLNPTQFILIPISKIYEAQAEEIQNRLRKFDIDSEVAYGSKSFRAKIRKYEEKQIPVLLIVGQKEVDNQSVSVRINNRDEGLITIDNLNSYLEANFFNK